MRGGGLNKGFRVARLLEHLLRRVRSWVTSPGLRQCSGKKIKITESFVLQRLRLGSDEHISVVDTRWDDSASLILTVF